MVLTIHQGKKNCRNRRNVSIVPRLTRAVDLV
jgi:hypothetical protein